MRDCIRVGVTALWARRSDSLWWYSNVNIACAIALGVLFVVEIVAGRLAGVCLGQKPRSFAVNVQEPRFWRKR
ncbi:MAG: hypothetical protein EPN76_10500 [Burkholderiaceae bacterium]|nr:MAG: hypothetical protein EPN76_10500 [Burkholderiaceae bacterium]TAM03243.1 MAG: hypothetical protein EPN67_09825 [Pusillimonas sp.]